MNIECWANSFSYSEYDLKIAEKIFRKYTFHLVNMNKNCDGTSKFLHTVGKADEAHHMVFK